jgi:hypothetical protein
MAENDYKFFHADARGFMLTLAGGKLNKIWAKYGPLKISNLFLIFPKKILISFSCVPRNMVLICGGNRRV